MLSFKYVNRVYMIAYGMAQVNTVFRTFDVFIPLSVEV